MTPTVMLHTKLKIYESMIFSLLPWINYGTSKSNQAYWNTYRQHLNKLRGDSEWCYWNGIIWSWANLFFRKKITFEIKWTLQNFNKVSEKLRLIKFPDYSNHACAINAYKDFVAKFLSVVYSFTSTRTLGVKSNTKPWFNIDVLNVIQNCDNWHR